MLCIPSFISSISITIFFFILNLICTLFPIFFSEHLTQQYKNYNFVVYMCYSFEINLLFETLINYFYVCIYLWLTCNVQGLTEYVVIGRALPTEANPQPTIYKMAIFAKNQVVAKSRFWWFIARLKKVIIINNEKHPTLRTPTHFLSNIKIKIRDSTKGQCRSRGPMVRSLLLSTVPRRAS